MKSVLVAASLFATALTFAAAQPVLADDDKGSCTTLHAQAKTALDAASGDVTEARREVREGLQACSVGYWQNGVVHYRKALSLLGQ